MDVKNQLIVQDTSTKVSRPKQTIQDLEELYFNQQTKRKEYEQQINKNKLNYGQWLRYARWELEHNHDFARARSIMERALDVDIQHIPFWIQYIQFELINKNINHARNLLERAITKLPKVNKLWFFYIQTEEMLKNYTKVRELFERWIEWNPDESCWDAYIHFESRYEEIDNVRNIYKRYVSSHNDGEIWLKWIDYELTNNESDKLVIRAIFESAVDSFLEKLNSNGIENEELFSQIIAKWLRWESKCMEYDRVKQIRTILVSNDRFKFSAKIKNAIYNSINEVEAILGDKDSIESGIIFKRKAKYEKDIEEDPCNFESWWSLISIIIQSDEEALIRQTFKKAVSNIPSIEFGKSETWKKFILLWQRYAFWEEFDNKELELARQVWNDCIKILTHQYFTSGKIWIGLFEFELRNNALEGLTKARKTFGKAMGLMNKYGPKPKVIKYYIKFESKLAEWDRVRSIYQKWLELSIIFGLRCNRIVKRYLKFEMELGETERCESVLKMVLGLGNDERTARSFDQEDMFNLAVDFFTDEMKYEEIRMLYRDRIKLNPTTDNWIALALFESSIPSSAQLEEYLAVENEEFEIDIGEEQLTNTREVFNEADYYFKSRNDNESRKVILEAFKDYEEVNGDEISLNSINARLPERIKKRRNIDGIEEEYYDYIFNDEKEDDERDEDQDNLKETNNDDTEEKYKPPPASLNKFLANAKKWAESQN
ncbi:CLF1 [Candida pseudojiufengensis]|uniref:CLF1 n=1 Tax=Candida pseudojiufengensis TaxID=497109 RepID=UPI00222524A4|nr:CLF1 [Candida pseudojiufengensis]KAI5966189.1 CLF1 [Candida pseudojiufengensis]